ncbi:MAG: hypothetical protein ACRDN0_22850, partial [Trebonia sp.]
LCRGHLQALPMILRCGRAADWRRRGPGGGPGGAGTSERGGVSTNDDWIRISAFFGADDRADSASHDSNAARE